MSAKKKIDPDTIMAGDEYHMFKKAMKEQKEGKTAPLSVIKKNLKL